MNGVSHTRFIIGSITFLSFVAMVLGFWLLLKGYQSGELLVTNGGVGGISGLIGFLGGKSMPEHKPGVANPDLVQTTTVETKSP